MCYMGALSMSDFAKSILAMVLTVVISSVATTSKLSADISNLIKSVDKIDTRLEKLDERVRKVEIKQAGQSTYLVAN